MKRRQADDKECTFRPATANPEDVLAASTRCGPAAPVRMRLASQAHHVCLCDAVRCSSTQLHIRLVFF